MHSDVFQHVPTLQPHRGVLLVAKSLTIYNPYNTNRRQIAVIQIGKISLPNKAPTSPTTATLPSTTTGSVSHYDVMNNLIVSS